MMDMSKFMDPSKMMDMSKITDMTKMMDDCKMPNVDVESMMAILRKGIEAITTKNQKAWKACRLTCAVSPICPSDRSDDEPCSGCDGSADA